MRCPKCGADGAVRNGAGRGRCVVQSHTFLLTDAVSQQDVEQAALAKRGFAPEHDMTHTVPAGFQVKGVSSLYREDGTLAAQWVKTAQDAEQMQAIMEAAILAFGEKIPREKARAAPKRVQADLLNCYVVTDYHLGMLSWHEETGADWDMDIAERMLIAWFAEAIAQSPDADVGVFAQLGDFLHYDGLDAVTPEHRNLLDSDTRFQKVVRVAIRCVRRIIGMLLEKHQTVRVIQAEGNHDPASSIWLREWLASLYENEPRVIVDRSPDPYYCIEHGLTSLFFHHGHKRKPSNIDGVFAAKFREVLGRTKFSYAHMGHMHHIDAKETALMVVEQHRTLASPDAYAARGGWMSGRDAQVVTYSKQWGEVGRVRVSSKMVEAA